MKTIGKIIRESFTPTSDTVYYYPLNGDYEDHSLNNLPDLTDNGCEFVMDGKVGKMIKFDKVNQKYLTLPPRVNFLNNLYDRTISYILLAKDIYTDIQAIVNFGLGGSYWQSCHVLFNRIHTSYDGITPLKPCISVNVRASAGEYSTQVYMKPNVPVLFTHTITAEEEDVGGTLRTYLDGRILNQVHINQRAVNLLNNNSFLGRGAYDSTIYYSDLILSEFIFEGKVWSEVEVSDYAKSIGF